MVYGERSNGKAHGVVLTKPAVVEKMLDLVGFKGNADLRAIKVVEPAAGEGAFALPLMRRLYESSQKYSFNFEAAIRNLTFYDIDPASLNVLKDKIIQEFPSISRDSINELMLRRDFLLADVEPCDLIIGNPPYVRHENIPDTQKEQYKQLFGTFVHRSDLYIPFYEKGLQTLKNNGILSYICANRWLKNQYGKHLRTLISNKFRLELVLNLEKVDAFEESVNAYPAITTIRNAPPLAPAPYYELDDLANLVKFSTDLSPTRTLSGNPANWFARDYRLNDTVIPLSSIPEQGFKIGIGVATGRDKIFIGKDLKNQVEAEVLLPMLTSRDVRGSKIQWNGTYFLNPYSPTGELIDLELYPKTKSYLQRHYDELVTRHVSKKNPTKWYRTIDKVHHDLTSAPKIILPDITGNTLIHIDKGTFYPHHNLYYITGKSIPELELLAAILMSDFVREQLHEMGNKMNGGYPRWQSQNIKKLKIPYLDSIPAKTKVAIRQAYKDQKIERINQLVTLANFANYHRTKGQLTLFESDSSKDYLAGSRK